MKRKISLLKINVIRFLLLSGLIDTHLTSIAAPIYKCGNEYSNRLMCANGVPAQALNFDGTKVISSENTNTRELQNNLREAELLERNRLKNEKNAVRHNSQMISRSQSNPAPSELVSEKSAHQKPYFTAKEPNSVKASTKK